MSALVVRLYDALVAFIKHRRGTKLRLGSVLSFKTHNGTVLRVEETGHVRGHGFLVVERACFVIVDPSDPYAKGLGARVRYRVPVGLRSERTGAFWGVNYDDNRVLNCDAGAVHEWETFVFELVKARRRTRRGHVEFGDEIAIRSFARWHGEEWNYLQYRLETSQLCRASVQHVKGWETFVVLPGSRVDG